eukprot:UN09257
MCFIDKILISDPKNMNKSILEIVFDNDFVFHSRASKS